MDEELAAYAEKGGICTDPLLLFKKSILDQKKDYPHPVPIVNLKYFDKCIPFLTKKSLSLWQGKQKSKKTTALAIVVASLIEDPSLQSDISFSRVEKGIVLFFDCEQGESYAARTMKLILKIAGVAESKALIYSDLRQFSPFERIEIIKAAIEETQNITLVVIDGLVDLMDDFMSPEEGHTIIAGLLKLTSEFNIHIAGVLHQNKGLGKDARGHVGSIASQKCEREIMVEVDTSNKNRSIISSKESRGKPFPSIAMVWNDDELPRIDEQWRFQNISSTSKKYTSPGILSEDIIELLPVEIFIYPAMQFGYYDLTEKVQNILTQKGMPIGKNKVSTIIKIWLESKIIIKLGKAGTKSAKYMLNDAN